MSAEAPQLRSASIPTASSYGYYAVVLLMLVYTFNIIDRNIIIILIEPIRNEMRLTDTQLGLLTGPVYAVFYAIANVAIAMLSDRGNRRNVIVVTLALFAGMTVLSGFAVGFVQLMLARILIAIGQAGSSPSAHSMISDMFPPARRSAAIGTYFMGANIAQFLLFLVGGWVAQRYGWREALWVAGAPGLLLVPILLFSLKEPVRGHADGLAAQSAGPAPGPIEIFRHLWQSRSFRHIITGITVGAVGSYAIVIWFPPFMSRSYGMSIAHVGMLMAVMAGLIGGLGTWASGHLADYLGRRDVRWNMWMVAILTILIFPCCVGMYLSGTKWLTIALYVYPSLVFTAQLAPCFAMTQALATVRMRALSSALFFFILTITGQGLAPPIVGFISDHLKPVYGAESLRYSLLAMTIFWPWAALHYYLAARTLKADIERTRRLTA
jgi:predicted MFS family arabinose efflux permease